MLRSFFFLAILAVCLTGVELFALARGINGVGLTAYTVAIGAIGGYWIKSVLQSRKEKQDARSERLGRA